MKSTEHLSTSTPCFVSNDIGKELVFTAVPKTELNTMEYEKKENISENSMQSRSVYEWIEFPEWASQLYQLRSEIQSACRQAKECDWQGGTIHIKDKLPNGRYSFLESMFRLHLDPFDCGGVDPIDNIPWMGWWRPGYRRLVISEITSSGEKFVPISDLESVIQNNQGCALRDALKKLIVNYKCLPPTTLHESQAPADV